MNACALGRPRLPPEQQHGIELKIRLTETQDARVARLAAADDQKKAAVARAALLLGLQILEDRLRLDKAA